MRVVGAAVGLRGALLLATLAAGAGCGGSGGGGGGGGTTTLTFTPSNDGCFSDTGAWLPNGGSAVSLGDDPGNISWRGYVRFGIVPFVPAGAVIVSAKLELRQQVVVGDAYGSLGTVVVDHVDFGVTIDGSDFSPTVLSPNIGTLSSDGALVVRQIDVTAAVVADLAGPGFNSNFLLRFTTGTDLDGVAELVRFEDAENDLGTGSPPRLLVTYR
jgi:hypothetical protein